MESRGVLFGQRLLGELYVTNPATLGSDPSAEASGTTEGQAFFGAETYH